MRWFWIIFAILILIILVWNIPAGKFSETLPVAVTIGDAGQIGVHTTKEPQKIFNSAPHFQEPEFRKQ